MSRRNWSILGTANAFPGTSLIKAVKNSPKNAEIFNITLRCISEICSCKSVEYEIIRDLIEDCYTNSRKNNFFFVFQKKTTVDRVTLIPVAAAR